MLSQVIELIEEKEDFAITTHSSPDGDGIGSSLGLWWLLRSLGKKAAVIVNGEFPESYRDLPGAEFIRSVTEVERKFDAVLAIECSDKSRAGIGGLEDQFVVNIDHHKTGNEFGDINWIDPTASAVGEMVYYLCKAIGGDVTREIAECIYLAIVTDTGSFRFPNTTQRTLKIASELVKKGVKPSRISEAIYDSYSWSRIELMQDVVATIRRDPSGRVASMRQTLEMSMSANPGAGDNSGFVNMPLSAKEVEAVVYMQETEPHLYNVSLRSKGDVNVATIAETLGGGGHKNAAGCRVSGDWNTRECEIMEMLLISVGSDGVEINGKSAHKGSERFKNNGFDQSSWKIVRSACQE